MVNNNTTYEIVKGYVSTIVKARVWDFVSKKSRLPYSKETVIKWVKEGLELTGYPWNTLDKSTQKMVREESIAWANTVLAQFQMKFDIGGRFYDR